MCAKSGPPRYAIACTRTMTRRKPEVPDGVCGVTSLPNVALVGIEIAPAGAHLIERRGDLLELHRDAGCRVRTLIALAREQRIDDARDLHRNGTQRRQIARRTMQARDGDRDRRVALER